MPIEEALNLGWSFSIEEQIEEQILLEQSHSFITKLEPKNLTQEWEKYYVTQEHLNGSGCELQVSKNKKYIEIEREFFSFDFPSDHLKTYSRKTKLSSIIKKR